MKALLYLFILSRFSQWSKLTAGNDTPRGLLNDDTYDRLQVIQQDGKHNTVHIDTKNVNIKNFVTAKRKMKGKGKGIACSKKDLKKIKSQKNIFKSKKQKWTIKQAEICFGAVSSKMPAIAQKMQPKIEQEKKPSKSPVVNTMRTSPEGALIKISFQSSLIFFRFPETPSEEQTNTVTGVITSALNSILPYGSTSEITSLSMKTYSSAYQANRTLVAFSTLSRAISCSDVSCIEASRLLYNETAQTLRDSVSNSSLVMSIHKIGANLYPSSNFQNIQVNPQSLRMGYYKLVPANNAQLSGTSTRISLSSSNSQVTLFRFSIICLLFSWSLF
jgi:hypothetical protein